MSKNRFLLRAILKGVIAILAAANLVALFGFNYEIPGLSSALSGIAVFGSNSVGSSGSVDGSSAGSSGSVDGSSAGGSGSSDGSDADDSSSGSAESETLSSDDSTSDETESDVDVLNAEVSGEASGEAGNAANEENDETIENTENVSESADASTSSESADGAADSGLVITVAEDLPAFSSSELSLLVDLLIDQNLIRAEDSSGNDITYDIVAEIADGDSEDERIVTFRVTDEEGESTSITAVIQVTG